VAIEQLEGHDRMTTYSQRIRPGGARAARTRAGKAVRLTIAIVVAVVMVFPLYWMLVVAFSPKNELFTQTIELWPSRLTLDNFATLFRQYPILTWFGNSVAITSITTALSVAVNLMAGYAFAKLRFVGKNTIFLVALATMMVPVQVTMVSQFKLVTSMGIYGTFWAVIFPSAATVFGIFLSRQFMIGIPDELIEAAKMDGANQARVFLRVVLPLCKPLIAVMVIVTAMGVWNDFAWPLIALKAEDLYTLPVGLLFLKGQFVADYNAIMALALLEVLPMVVLFLVFQRQFVQGFARSGIK
jgi:multiple sugar transport system permease protein